MADRTSEERLVFDRLLAEVKTALTRQEVADLLHVSRRTVDRMIDRGELDVYRVGKGRLKVPLRAVRAYLDPAHVADEYTVEVSIRTTVQADSPTEAITQVCDRLRQTIEPLDIYDTAAQRSTPADPGT